jgi:hypothetical protein
MLAPRRSASSTALALISLVFLAVAFAAGRATASGGGMKPVGPGPYRMVDGVTLGFAHTEVGATAAAAHYLLEIERAMDSLSVARTTEIARLLATTNEAQAVEAHASSMIALEEADGAPLRRVAIATESNSYSPASARITVLESWIYATSSQEALWAIERVSLIWAHGGWRVSAIAGAAPSANESLADLRAQLSYAGLGDASVR